MSYYLNNETFITEMTKFVFKARRFHLVTSNKFVGEEPSHEAISAKIKEFIYLWLCENPNSMKFYSSRVKDANKPKIADEINKDFITELTEKIMESCDSSLLKEASEDIVKSNKRKAILLKKQKEYEALSQEEKLKSLHRAIVKSEDYWASKGHHVN